MLDFRYSNGFLLLSLSLNDNLVQLLNPKFEQLIYIERLIEMWMFVGVCVSGYVCVSFSQVEVASNTYCQSLFHPLCNNLYSIHNCLLSKNPGNVSPLVTKN